MKLCPNLGGTRFRAQCTLFDRAGDAALLHRLMLSSNFLEGGAKEIVASTESFNEVLKSFGVESGFHGELMRKSQSVWYFRRAAFALRQCPEQLPKSGYPLRSAQR